MPETRKCKHCGKPFLLRKRHYNQRYCSVACRTQAQDERDKQAQREREENRKFGINQNLRIHNSTSCRELWEQYRYFKRLMWIPEQAKIERLLRDKGCWFKRKLSLTNKERKLAEERDKEIA